MRDPYHVEGARDDAGESSKLLLFYDRSMYAALVESLGGIVWEADALTFQFTFVSRHAEEVLGYPIATWLAPGFWVQHTHADDVERVSAFCLAATLRGENHQFEYRMLSADGDVVWLRDIVTVTLEPDGRKRLRGIMIDITERREHEHELQVSRERLALAQLAGRVGTFEWDIPTRATIWTPEMYALYGATPLMTPAEVWQTHVHPDDAESAMDAAKAAAVSGVLDAEWRVVWPDGSAHWLHGRGKAPLDEEGRPQRMLGAVIDVTERKQLEEQLRQSQKMEAIGRLAGGVAHDFNNLLTVITAYGDFIAASMDVHDPHQSDLNEIRCAADRASLLTQQLLAFSRRQVVRPQVLDINAIVTEMARMLARLIGDDVTLKVDLAENAGATVADAGQMHQVLMNLVVNARDAMPYGGAISIATHAVAVTVDLGLPVPPGDYVVLSVSDTGVGMTEAVRAKIFEPFFTTKEAGRGTGLGLSTVYGIVQQSSGHVRVHSAVDHGTTFDLFFPRAPEGRDEATTPVVVETSGTEVVLFVEGERALREAGARILTQRGYRVLTAHDPSEALRISKAYLARIDLLIAEVVMPGLSGTALAARLLVARPGTRVLFVSGYSDDALGQHGVFEDGVNFLHKPFSEHTLARKVREVLDAVAGTTSD